jgi:biotin carboxyl carrier protein
MPCSIVKVNVKVGDDTKKGQALLVLSSMKMESVIEASEDGVVEEVYVTEGQNIEAGYLMLKMKENQKES